MSSKHCPQKKERNIRTFVLLYCPELLSILLIHPRLIHPRLIYPRLIYPRLIYPRLIHPRFMNVAKCLLVAV